MVGGSVVWLGVLLAIGGAADARPEQAGDLVSLVQRLVAELDAPELSRRQNAEDELVGLGTRALDLLPRAPGPGSAEAAQRLARVRRKLEQAQAGLGPNASRISLKGTMPLSRVLESIEKQTGNAFDASRIRDGNGPLQREVEIDFHQTPFWPALDSLLGKTGLEVYSFGGQRRIELRVPGSPTDRSARHVAYAGPLRIELVGLQSQRDFRSGTGSLKLDIEVAWEPRLAPISLTQRMSEVAGIDDRGRRLAADAPAAELEIPVPPGPIATRFTLPLALPPRDARVLRELRGALRILAPGPAGTFRFAGLAEPKPSAQRAGGVTVALEGAAKLGKTLEVRLAVRFDEAHDALASHRTWIFGNPIHLETRDQKRIEPESISPTRQTVREVGIAVFFPIDRGLDEYALVYETPTSILASRLEYQFRDVPLP